MKIFFVTLISFLLSAQAFAAAANVKKQNGEVLYTATYEAPSLDVTYNVDAVSAFWLGHLSEGLVTLDAQGHLTPGTAEKFQVSSDGKKYTFFIRKNAKWHDGKPVRARDFEYAFRRLVDPAYASQYSFIAETARIQNAGDIIRKKKAVKTLGVKAVDDHTLEVQLEAPVTFFPGLMNLNVFYPVRQDYVEKFKDKYATDVDKFIGNGPFKMVRWIKEHKKRIEKTETYWNASQIKLKAIEEPSVVSDSASLYQLFQTNGLDMINLDKERLKLASKDKIKVYPFLTGQLFYHELNTRPGKVFSNKLLRQALKYGTNRAEYVNKVRAIPGAQVAFGFVPSIIPGTSNTTFFRKENPLSWKDNDFAKAKELVKQYLKETNQTKVPSFTILTEDPLEVRREGEYFQAQLTKLFETEIKVDAVPFKTRLQKSRDGEFDLVMGVWGPDYMDPMTFLDLYSSWNENNHSGWKSTEYDKLIKSAQSEADAKKRMQILSNAEKMLLEELPIIPYMERARSYIVRHELKGVRRNQIGVDPDFRFARWE